MKYIAYICELKPARMGLYEVIMRPVMTLDATCPVHALRIAKRRGIIAPIIGVADHV